MRFLTLLFLTFSLSACVAATPPVPTTEAAQRLEAEQLVRLSLTGRIIENVQTHYFELAGPMLSAKEVPAELAGRVVREEMEQMIAAEHQRLLDALVPIYRRYYTADEIHQLLSFYQTEVARKSLKVSGQIAADGQPIVRTWQEHFGGAFLQRLKARMLVEGIDLGL